MVVREVLDNGLRLITETMPHVRSVTIGVWLTRGSRHETDERSGIAHFVEHMLFKGSDTRTAEDIAKEAAASTGIQLGNPNEVDSLRRKIVELNSVVAALKRDNIMMKDKLEKIKKIA